MKINKMEGHVCNSRGMGGWLHLVTFWVRNGRTWNALRSGGLFASKSSSEVLPVPSSLDVELVLEGTGLSPNAGYNGSAHSLVTNR